MNTDGLHTIHSYTIPFSKYGEEINLWIFGDIHRHAPLCNIEKWKKELQRMKNTPNSYFLGMGDYDDILSSSERIVFASPKLHESTKANFFDYAQGMVEDLADEMSFMKGKVVGLIGGNHFVDFEDGTTSDQRLCRELGCKYLGCSSVIKLSFQYCKSNPFNSHDLIIWAHHGKGASRTPGGSINRVEQMREAWEGDIYVMGHDHKRSAFPCTKLELHQGKGALKIHHKKQWLIRSGSYLKAYDRDKRSYIAAAASNPVDQGCIRLIVIPTRLQGRKDGKKWEDRYLDTHALI